MDQPKTNLAMTVITILVTTAVVATATALIVRFHAPMISIDQTVQKIVKYNCEQSGGTFSRDVCLCKDAEYDQEIGYCIDSFGAPGGTIGGVTRDLQELQMLKNGRVMSNLFDPLKNKVGDTIAGMKLISVKPFVGDKLSLENVDAQFLGRVTLSGEYDYELDPSLGEGAYRMCFRLVGVDEKLKVPVLNRNSDQGVYFCFDDLADAHRGFGSGYVSGQAMIVIDRYRLISGAKVTSMAQLVEVISKTPAKKS